MTYTSPATIVTGTIIATSWANTHVRDNELHLGGTDGTGKTGHYTTIPIALGNITGATSVNLSQSNVYRGTLTGAVTLTLTDPRDGVPYRLELRAAGFAITWPASVVWGDAGAPTLSGANKLDIISLVYNSVEANYFGVYSLGFDV